MSPYLRNQPRTLAECLEDLLHQIDLLEDRIVCLKDAILHANGEEHDTLGMAIDNASDELARLEDRLDQLDDELGNRRDDDPGMPQVI